VDGGVAAKAHSGAPTRNGQGVKFGETPGDAERYQTLHALAETIGSPTLQLNAS